MSSFGKSVIHPYENNSHQRQIYNSLDFSKVYDHKYKRQLPWTSISHFWQVNWFHRVLNEMMNVLWFCKWILACFFTMTRSRNLFWISCRPPIILIQDVVGTSSTSTKCLYSILHPHWCGLWCVKEMRQEYSLIIYYLVLQSGHLYFIITRFIMLLLVNYIFYLSFGGCGNTCRWTNLTCLSFIVYAKFLKRYGW